MMLTGRTYNAEKGADIGLSQYVVDDGAGMDEALRIASQIASNSPASNFAITQALPRIAQADPSQGYLMESLTAAIAQGTDEAKSRMQEFLAGRGARIYKGKNRE